MVKYFKDMNNDERKSFYMRSGYVKDIITRPENNLFHKEALKKIERYVDTYKDKIGIIRWKNSGNIPPRELLILWKYKKKRFDIDLNLRALDMETSNTLNHYRAVRKYVSKEDLLEQKRNLRSAFGEGVIIKDILTGETKRS